MKLASFTMFRNEAPILGAFLDQLDEFFDHMFLVNHESSDASVDIIKKRLRRGTELFHLKSPGYPQSELATYFTHRIFKETDADWLFFLDCDEFLPFASRAALLAAIVEKSANHDILQLSWRNLLPDRLDGGDIFSGGFQTLRTKSTIGKIILSRRLVQRGPQLRVWQGYHGVDAAGIASTPNELSDVGLLHIPIQSKYRFAAKIRASGQKLIDEATLYTRGLGYHWVVYHRQLEQQGIRNFDFTAAALNYSGVRQEGSDEKMTVDFTFDYVKSPYHEDFDDLFTQMYGGLDSVDRSGPSLLYDDRGTLLLPLTSGTLSTLVPSLPRMTESAPPAVVLDQLGLGATYSDLIEPLFSLPEKVLASDFNAHSPFLFVLFRLMRPRSFVELGANTGAGLITAATAAATYQVPGVLYGVDDWTGQRLSEGTVAYEKLSWLLESHFKRVQLIRAHPDQASALFAPESVDLLLLGGPQDTFDAIKHNFMTWLPKMSPSGVILLRHVADRDSRAGGHRLWGELEGRFATLLFPHSCGLGVILLDNQSESLKPLMRVMRNPDFARFYQLLAADIGGLVGIRGRYQEDPSDGGQLSRLEAENERLSDEIKYRHAEAAAYKAELRSLGILGLRRLLRLSLRR